LGLRLAELLLHLGLGLAVERPPLPLPLPVVTEADLRLPEAIRPAADRALAAAATLPCHGVTFSKEEEVCEGLARTSVRGHQPGRDSPQAALRPVGGRHAPDQFRRAKPPLRLSAASSMRARLGTLRARRSLTYSSTPWSISA